MNDNQLSNDQNQAGTGGLPPMPVSDMADQSQSTSFQPRSQNTVDLQNQISTLPPEAKDIDLIEKEWVTHLKYIVANTNEDPYLQQSEISKAKADYMYKRYNKSVKISEG